MINKNKIINILITSMLIIVFYAPNIANNNMTVEAIETNHSKSYLYVGGAGPGNYSSIQNALDNSNNGDTIYVYGGTYYENITIDKSVNLIGENKNITIIDSIEENHVINISSNFVNISGFTITNSSLLSYGIFINADNISITNNIITDNYHGLNITGNNVNISYNNISSNLLYGLIVFSSSNNISNNVFYEDGIYVIAENNNISNNFANSNPIIYLENISNYNISETPGQIILMNCNNISIHQMNISITDVGIQLINTNNCNISENNISNNVLGIEISGFSNNISFNTFEGDGIYVKSGTNNISNNVINSQPLVYYENISNIAINEDAGQIIINSCNNISIQNKNISDNVVGIQILDSINCNISHINISNNIIGIQILNSNNYNISNINISNSYYGIEIGNISQRSISKNINISYNNISNCYISGIKIAGTNSNIIKNNISNCRDGLIISTSIRNNISYNNISKNYNYGINLINTNYCQLKYNNLSMNSDGIFVEYSNNNNISYNNITNNDYCGMYLFDSSANNNISLNYFINNNFNGIFLTGSNNDNNIFYKNNISKNSNYGIYITGNFNGNNNIYKNNITLNGYSGIIITPTNSNNHIFNNNFIGNNNFSAIDHAYNNWNKGSQIGGNYWSDYIGYDFNFDGFGDIPYNITGSTSQKDYLPLMYPYESYLAQGNGTISWVVYETNEWNSAENSSLNTQINNGNLELEEYWGNWQDIWYEPSSYTANGPGYETAYTNDVDCSSYDEAKFSAYVMGDYIWDNGPINTYGYVRFTGTMDYIYQQGPYQTYGEVMIPTNNYGNQAFQVAGDHYYNGWYWIDTDGTGSIFKIQGRNIEYESSGSWTSNWKDMDFLSFRQLKVGVHSIGGGLKVKVECSDDGITVKDDTGWMEITRSGNIINDISSLQDARYCRIIFELIEGSTPSISSFMIKGIQDITPPLWRNQNQNKSSIISGESIMLYSQGKDEIELDWAWLSTNETGTWQNYTDRWWNQNWKYRKIIPIINASNSYEMKINIGYSSGEDVSCNEHCQMNFDDIRFISSDNNTELAYWKQSYNNAINATYWVKTSENVEDLSYIYIYYGNENVETTSNANNTFIYWNNYSYDPEIIENSKGNYTIHNNINLMKKDNFTMSIRLKLDGANSGTYGSPCYIGLINTIAENRILGWNCRDDSDAPPNGIALNGQVWPSGTFGIEQIDHYEWIKTELNVCNGSVEFYYNGSLVASNVYNDSGYYPDLFKLWGWSNSYMSYDIDEWDSSEENMHFKIRRTDSGIWREFRWDDLIIRSLKEQPPSWGTIDDEECIDQIYKYNSPIKLIENDQWQWSNFTWQNESCLPGTIIGWKIYYIDTYGNINHTDIMNFKISIPPIANFTYEPENPDTIDVIQFNDSSIDTDGYITNWTWDMGDGSILYGEQIEYSYIQADEYTVCLTIYDNDGASDMICKNIQISEPIEIEDINQSIFNRGFPIRHAADGDWAAAQSFLPTITTISNCKIYMRKFGNPEFNLTVNLRTDHPQGPILDTLIFIPEEIPSSWTWYTLDFNDTTVTPDIEYFIVCPPAPSGVTTSFGYEWGYAFGNQYDDGAFWFTRDGGALWRDLPTSYEFVFKTYGYN